MSTRELTAALWLFAVLTAGGVGLLAHAVVFAADAGSVVVAASPAAITGGLAFTSWYTRRETRAARALVDAADLAEANDRESRLGR